MTLTVGSSAAVPFWRAVGMTYVSYSNICANLVSNYLKEPFKSEALTRKKVHFSISNWVNGVPQKPGFHHRTSAHCHQLCIYLWINNRKKELIKFEIEVLAILGSF